MRLSRNDNLAVDLVSDMCVGIENRVNRHNNDQPTNPLGYVNTRVYVNDDDDDDEYAQTHDMFDMCYDEIDYDMLHPCSISQEESSDVLDGWMLSDNRAMPESILVDVPVKYQKKGVVYLCRIFTDRSYDYKYIIGYTDDIIAAVVDINDIYSSDGDMEILTIEFAKSRADVAIIGHELMLKNCRMDDGLYVVDEKIYDYMATISTYVNPVFITYE